MLVAEAGTLVTPRYHRLNVHTNKKKTQGKKRKNSEQQQKCMLLTLNIHINNKKKTLGKNSEL